MTHGAWDVIEAIMDRWAEAGLDDQFTATWDDAADAARFSPIWDGEAEAGAPRPYCVFEHDAAGTPTMMSTDVADSVAALVPQEIYFRIHGRTKTEAVDMAKLVAAAYDNAGFAAGTSCVIGMKRLADYGSRDDPDGWLWVLRYGLTQDAVQAIN